jgi:hypothetical protein
MLSDQNKKSLHVRGSGQAMPSDGPQLTQPAAGQAWAIIEGVCGFEVVYLWFPVSALDMRLKI